MINHLISFGSRHRFPIRILQYKYTVYVQQGTILRGENVNMQKQGTRPEGLGLSENSEQRNLHKVVIRRAACL